jgi:hypothetical protein
MSPSVLLQSASLLLTNASAPPTTNHSMLQGNYHIYNNNQPRTYAQVTDYTAAAAGALRPTSYSSLGLPTFQQGSNASAPPKGFVPVKPNIMEEFTQSRRDGMGALQMGGA